MNKVGIYFAFWENEWDADYCYYIKKVSRLGFDVLEVAAASLLEISKERRKEIEDCAKAEGIDLTYCIGLPPQYDLAHENSQVRKEGIQYVKKLLECIHEMGGDTLGGILYSCWPGNTVSYDYKQKARERSLCSLKEIAKTAEDYGINYCLEIVNRFEQYLLNTASEGVDFVKELESPRMKLLLDSFHMNIEEDSLYEAIRIAGDLLGHFHIGECNRKTPGLGRMDWSSVCQGLKDIQYQGKIVMEPFIRPGGQVGKDIKIYRDQSGNATEQKMDQLAQDALVFMREKMGECKDGKN